jgi:hypothetical protein
MIFYKNILNKKNGETYKKVNDDNNLNIDGVINSNKHNLPLSSFSIKLLMQ